MVATLKGQFKKSKYLLYTVGQAQSCGKAAINGLMFSVVLARPAST